MLVNPLTRIVTFLLLCLINTCTLTYLLTYLLNGHIKTAKQRTVIQQYGGWYTGRWWVGCYIWYSEEGPVRAVAPLSPLLAVANVTAHPSTASVPTSYYTMCHYNFLCTLKGLILPSSATRPYKTGTWCHAM